MVKNEIIYDRLLEFLDNFIQWISYPSTTTIF
jgi:hypothetical protein